MGADDGGEKRKWRKIEFPDELDDGSGGAKDKDAFPSTSDRSKATFSRGGFSESSRDRYRDERGPVRGGVRGGLDSAAEGSGRGRDSYDDRRTSERDLRPSHRHNRDWGRDRPGRDPGRAHGRPPIACLAFRHPEASVFIHSVQSGLWPIQDNHMSRVRAAYHGGLDVVLIFAKSRSEFLMGCAYLTSVPFDEREEDHPFPSDPQNPCDFLVRVRWKLFGEFAFKLFDNIPSEDMSGGGHVHPRRFFNGTIFSKDTADAVVDTMSKTALKYSLPPPIEVANHWSELLHVKPWVSRKRSPHPAKRGRTVSSEERSESQGYGADAPRRRNGASGSRGGGFMRQGRPREPAVPPGIVGGKAAPEASALPGGSGQLPGTTMPFAQRQLLDLSYEEYLEVYGLVEQLWKQRQVEELKQEAMKMKVEERKSVMSEAQYIQHCKSLGFGHLTDDDIRAAYRQKILQDRI